MDHASEITGLDLFTMPFRSQQACSMAAPASSREAARSASASVSRMQNEKPTAPQSNKTVLPSQPADPKPLTEQAGKADTLEKAVPENKGSGPGQVPEHPPVKEAKAPGLKQRPQEDTQAQPGPLQKELALDMSDHTVPVAGSLDNSEEARRKAHEEAEAERKAKWEERQREKQEKEQAALQRLQSMSDADVAAASTECIRLAIERITRRNMKECVAGHIQEICQKSPGFARCVMHPRKSLANCFRYINRQARDYLKNEMEENGIVPEDGGYGGDVPDQICYQWAEEYFRDPDAPEDRDKEDEFVPRPYVGRTVKKKAAKKSTAKKGGKKKQETTDDSNFKQMSLEGIDQ